MSEHFQSESEFECRGGDDAAAYSLGALDAHELAAFERHLQTCSVCQAEVESLQQLTNVLPMTAPRYPAPKRLRRRVMAEVRADARRQQAAREFGKRPRAGRLRVGGLGTGGGGGLRGALGLDGGGRGRPGLIGAGAAAVLVLVVVLVGLTASSSQKGSSHPHVIAASVGSAQVLISAGHGELIVHRLKQLPVTETYEVWKKGSSGSPQPTSALFNTSSTGDSAVNVPGSLQGVKEILVTREPSGGTAVPSTPAVVVARIS